ncbi:hypothetical protein SAMN05444359_103185 [Neolewinella agarilytica]|uniref:Uncharacterized protein n=1 Tax=Neolewinella agarilytica TaxID=478744 RepID=A0A1H9BM23_9BACT|nr:hypothetical protein SAMN05444359_103185 [Neolewinella agarilytica]
MIFIHFGLPLSLAQINILFFFPSHHHYDA